MIEIRGLKMNVAITIIRLAALHILLYYSIALPGSYTRDIIIIVLMNIYNYSLAIMISQHYSMQLRDTENDAQTMERMGYNLPRNYQEKDVLRRIKLSFPES